MPRFETDPEIRALGEALALLRRERGLSQAEAGRRAGMTSQGWGLYESGRRPGLFRPDVQRRLVAALDASPEDLALARSRQQAAPEPPTPTFGLNASGRTFHPAAGGVRRLQLSNDDLAPWAASGVVLEFDPQQWPRRDQGCVIETVDGTVLVRLYEGADSQTLTVRGGEGGLGVVARIARSDIRTVSAVTARLER